MKYHANHCQFPKASYFALIFPICYTKAHNWYFQKEISPAVATIRFSFHQLLSPSLPMPSACTNDDISILSRHNIVRYKECWRSVSALLPQTNQSSNSPATTFLTTVILGDKYVSLFYQQTTNVCCVRSQFCTVETHHWDGYNLG